MTSITNGETGLSVRGKLNVILADQTYATVADMAADSAAVIGDTARVLNYSAASQSGVLNFVAVALATGTADGGSLIAGSGVQWRQLFSNTMRLTQWGCANAPSDSTAQAQKALNFAFLGILYGINNQPRVECGTRLLYFASSLNVPQGVVFAGLNTYPSGNAANKPIANTIKLANAATITLEAGATLEGVEVLNNNFVYPANAAQVATWAGTAVFSEGPTSAVKNCKIVGFDRGIDFVSNPALPLSKLNRQYLENVYLDCKRPLRIKGSQDIDRASNIHCWPFGSAIVTASSADYVRPGPAIDIVDCSSWIKLTGSFEFAYNIGYRIFDSAGVVLDNCATDGTSDGSDLNKKAILIESTTQAPATSVFISNHYFRASMKSAVEINCLNGTDLRSVGIVNSLFYGQDVAQQINIIDGESVVLTGNIIRQQGETAKLISIGANMGLNLTMNGNQVINQTVPPLSNAASGYTTNTVLFDTSNLFTGSFTNIWTNGTDGAVTVASAASVKLPPSIDYIKITGTVTISTLFNSYANRIVTLEIVAGLQMNETATIKLLTGANTIYSADDRVRFMCCGSVWREI